MAYSRVDINSIEPSGPGGAVRFVRRELGVEAFGVNWFELAAGQSGPEHDESGTQQEEVNVVVRGSGRYRIDGEDVEFEAPVAFRFDPETTRQLHAGPDGVTMVAIGAQRGSYQPRGPF